MDSVDASLLDAVRAFFLAETRRIAGQRQRKFFFRNNAVNKFSDHGMLAGSNQIQIFAFDFVHHGFHLGETHHSVYDISMNHKRRHTISKAAVDHKITGICKDSGMQSRNISHQIIESVSGNLPCAVQVDSSKDS